MPTTPITPACVPPALHTDAAVDSCSAGSSDSAEDDSRFLPIRCSATLAEEKLGRCKKELKLCCVNKGQNGMLQ